MSFYGKDPEPKTSPDMKRFYYILPGQANADSVKAQHVFFYESGHVGFWDDTDNGGRTLVLAVKANDVWEEEV